MPETWASDRTHILDLCSSPLIRLSVRCDTHTADFDQGGALTERLRLSGFYDYITSEDLEDGAVPTELDISTLDDNRTQFGASTRGYGGDNAQDPDDLTDLQEARMVELLYVNTQCVTMR